MPSKGIVYYTDHHCQENILSAVRINLSRMGLPIVSVSHEKLEGFGKNITVDMDRGILTMFKQILIGLEASKSKIIFLAEHDVLYNPTHFEFTPPKKNIFYYNINTWVVNTKTKQRMIHKEMKVSMLCAYRKLLVKHYRKRVAMLEKEWRTYMMFEPGLAKNIDDYEARSWESENPNIDLRHGNNLTGGRFGNLGGGVVVMPSNGKLGG